MNNEYEQTLVMLQDNCRKALGNPEIYVYTLKHALKNNKFTQEEFDAADPARKLLMVQQTYLECMLGRYPMPTKEEQWHEELNDGQADVPVVRVPVWLVNGKIRGNLVTIVPTQPDFHTASSIMMNKIVAEFDSEEDKSDVRLILTAQTMASSLSANDPKMAAYKQIILELCSRLEKRSGISIGLENAA